MFVVKPRNVTQFAICFDYIFTRQITTIYTPINKRKESENYKIISSNISGCFCESPVSPL